MIPGALGVAATKWEMYHSTSHAKFYTAISTIAMAPCVVGKSSMFRRSHLDYLTSLQKGVESTLDLRNSADLSDTEVDIDYFSHYICEDHLMGSLLWRSSLPNEPAIGNHGLVFGDLVFQSVAFMSVPAYVARQIRWIRVRKFTETLASLLEPGTESFLCSAYGAFGVTTLLWEKVRLHVAQPEPVIVVLWVISVSIWAMADWTLHLLLHSGRTIETDDGPGTPAFAQHIKRTVSSGQYQDGLSIIGC